MRNRSTEKLSKVCNGRVVRYYSVPHDYNHKENLTYRPCLTFVVRVQSSNLWTSKLTKKQTENYKLVKELRDEGLTYKQISNELNQRSLTTTRNKPFSSPLVHSLEKKMDKRIDRITKVFPIKISDMKIEFEDLIIHKRKQNEKVVEEQIK